MTDYANLSVEMQPVDQKTPATEYAEAPTGMPKGYGPAIARVKKGDAYTWDVVLVFAVGDPNKDITVRTKGADRRVTKSKRPQQEIFSERAARVISKVRAADLKYCLYKSVKGDHVFMLIGATENRLRREADRVDYDLELDPVLTLGLGCERKLKLAMMTKDEQNSRYAAFQENQWEGMFGPYKPNDARNPKRDELYKHWEQEDGTTSPFRQVDRLKLTTSILEANEKHHGAGLKSNKFIRANDHPLVACFPLHDLPAKEKIWDECKAWHAIFHIPVEQIRNYFGEQIGFYFAFLRFYSMALLFPTIFGIALFVWQLVTNQIDIPGLPAYALVVAVWATVFLELWKRQECVLQYGWGMSKFAEKEEPRPQFRGDWVPSPIDGKMVAFFPAWKKLYRVFCGQTVIWTCVVLATAAAGALLVARQTWVLAAKSQQGKSDTELFFSRIGIQVGAAVLNALQVQIGNIIYKKIALYLNEWENHRTDTEFENALIAKTFLFEVINSYATLTYIAFFKRFDSAAGCLDGDGCLAELRVQLGMVFITQLIVNNALELGKPLIKNCRANKKMAANETPDHQLSGPEEEFNLQEYDSPFGDFDEIVIQYGYATLFVVALPVTPLLYLINNVVELYLDSYKICKLTRRPEPRGATNIGTWSKILNIQGYLAVISNCALVTYVANKSIKLADQEDTYIWLTFIIAEHALIVVKFLVGYFVPDVPPAVIMKHKRQEYIVDALIHDMDVEDINEDEVDQLVDPDENPGDQFVDDKYEDPEVTSRKVAQFYPLGRIPTTFQLGMAAVSGKDAYGAPIQEGQAAADTPSST